MRLLDLFCGRWGWSKAFAARGWECVGVDLVEPPEIPQGCKFVRANVLDIGSRRGGWFYISERRDGGPILWEEQFDFACISSPCENFSLFGLKNFHPNPPYPELGIQLFNHSRGIAENSGIPYLMENVRAAQQFVGKSMHHCGPFHLWGTGVPTLVPQGIIKGICCGNGKAAREAKANGRIKEYRAPYAEWNNRDKVAMAAKVATIPPELANCVADYAERILEPKFVVGNEAGECTGESGKSRRMGMQIER